MPGSSASISPSVSRIRRMTTMAAGQMNHPGPAHGGGLRGSAFPDPDSTNRALLPRAIWSGRISACATVKISARFMRIVLALLPESKNVASRLCQRSLQARQSEPGFCTHTESTMNKKQSMCGVHLSNIDSSNKSQVRWTKPAPEWHRGAQFRAQESDYSKRSAR